MKTNTKKDEKLCWACKRILVEDGKLGLCPECVNKYGTPAAGLVALGIGVLGKKAWKNSGKIAKGVINVVKHIK